MLNRIFREHGTFLIIFAIFLAIFFWFLNLTGYLGHDYLYFFPKLLDGKWHFLRQGILPFWYTPHYCGGMPEYGNPQSLFYTPLQLLVLFLDLWLSAQVIIAASLIIGYAGWYRFARDIIRFPRIWAHVLTLIIIAHGFYFMHMVPGHIIYSPMPLIGWMLWLLFDDKLTIRRTAIFALLAAYTIYNGGFVAAMSAVIAFIILMPFILLNTQEGVWRVLRVYWVRWVSYGVASILIVLSKLVAVWSVMRFFPRQLPFEQFPEDVSIITYIFKAFWAVPQLESVFEPYGMPDWGALHEYSMYVSPVVLVGLLCGLLLIWKKRREFSIFNFQFSIYIAYSLLLIIFCLQLVRGYGFLVTPLETVPIFSSLRYTMRFLYAFSFLPIILSIWCIMRYVRNHPKLLLYERSIAIGACAVTVVAFFIAHYKYMAVPVPPRTMNYEEALMHINNNEGFLMLNVTQVFDMAGQGHSEFVPLFFGGNDVRCHEPLYLGEGRVELPELIAGDVHIVQDDAFNLLNPACLQYPEENRCEPGERISIYDEANLEQFRKGLPTTWRISTLQHVSNWVTLITFFICVFALLPLRSLYALVRRFFRICFA